MGLKAADPEIGRLGNKKRLIRIHLTSIDEVNADPSVRIGFRIEPICCLKIYAWPGRLAESFRGLSFTYCSMILIIKMNYFFLYACFKGVNCTKYFKIFSRIFGKLSIIFLHDIFNHLE